MRYFGLTIFVLIGTAMCLAATNEVAQSQEVLEQVEGSDFDQSVVMWVIESIGVFGLLTIAAAFGVFVGSCVVVLRAPDPSVITRYRVVLLVPLLIGAVNAVRSCIFSHASESIQIAGVVAHAAFTIFGEALVLTFPSYCVLAIGEFVGTRIANRRLNVVSQRQPDVADSTLKTPNDRV